MSPFRTRDAYEPMAWTLASALDCSNDEVMTRQEFKDDADINVLVRRFGVTGALPPPAPPEAYGDFSGVEDFQTAMLELQYAEGRFMELRSDIRERFQNSPGELLAFLSDEANHDEAVELGLIPASEPPEPAPEPVPEDPPTGEPPAS